MRGVHFAIAAAIDAQCGSEQPATGNRQPSAIFQVDLICLQTV